MNQLKFLKDIELNQKLKTLAAEERRLLQTVLLHIAEIDRRKLYLRMAYPSLFDYLTKEICYSAGAAQRRIDAARLLQRIPTVANKIESGSINLSQISKLQKICRQIKKDSGQVIQARRQAEVLQKLENQGSVQTDLVLAQEFQIKIATQDKQTVQRDESIRIEITFSKEEMSIIKRAQELLSHKTGGTLKQTVVEMAMKVIKSAELKSRYSTRPQTQLQTHRTSHFTKEVESTAAIRDFTATVAVKSSPPKTVTPKWRREILHRDKHCIFKDRTTGQVCGSKLFLEVDHVRPRYAQGNNSSDNLRILCKAHNIFRYQAGL